MLNQLVNKGACGAANIFCTGADYCELDIRDIKTLYFAKYGYKLPTGMQGSNVLELIEMQKEVLALNILPKGGVKNTAYTTEANRVRTYNSGEKSLIGTNPVQMDFTFEGGIQNYQAFVTLMKRKKHSVFIVDKNGTVFMSKNVQGLLGGLNVPFAHAEAYKGYEGTEGGDFMVQLQINREVFDNELVGLKSEYIDYNAIDELNCLGEVIPVPTTVQINGLGAVSFEVKQWADQHTVTGLDLTEFKVKVNGVIVAGTTTANNTVYTFTRGAGTFATGEEIEIIVEPQYIGEYGYKGASKFIALAV